MRIITALFLLTLGTICQAKEYKNLERYTIETGNKTLDRKDWLSSDRKDNTFQWQQACLFNFSYYGGHKQYETVEERQAFLVWMNDFIKNEGHEVKWISANVLLFDLFVDAKTKNTASGIKELVKNVNKPVFDTAFVSFQGVHSAGYILRSNEAKQFDTDLYEFEHTNYYQYFIKKMSTDDLATLNKILDRKGLGHKSAIPEALELDGNVQDYTQRLYWMQSKVQPYSLGKRPTEAELEARREAKKENFRDAEIKITKEKKVKEEKVKKVKTEKVKKEKTKKIKEVKESVSKEETKATEETENIEK